MELAYRRTVDDALAIAEHEWRLNGVDRRDLAALANDLRLDLEAAAADGVTPDRLIGADVRGFARRLADESGARRIPYQYRRIMLTALAGAVPGLALGYAMTFGRYISVDLNIPVGALAFYGTGAAVILLGALIAVWVRLRDVPRIRGTVAGMAALLPVVSMAVAPVTVGFAALTDYSTSVPVVAAEIALVGSALAGAVVLARRWALR